METTLLNQNQLGYAEVYASDILELKNIFLLKFKLNKINENFGIPFLMIKKKNEAIAFANLVLKSGKIDFEIYEKESLNEQERNDFLRQANDYFKTKKSENFRNPEQLESSILQMIDWLNE
ncbi:hypothetical protein [Chryseobacterium daeguense]|uniref:hypothetical protein n=1 Tax=Chryseobacterium daeguense TaxID=412438 RepID=UPI0004880C82|nr:hypothetical protein [Chryseobacterium daeguense]